MSSPGRRRCSSSPRLLVSRTSRWRRRVARPEFRYLREAIGTNSMPVTALPRYPCPVSSSAHRRQVSVDWKLPAELAARVVAVEKASTAEDIDTLVRRFSQRLGRAAVRASLSPLHPTVEMLLAKDEKIRRESLANGYSWREPTFDHPLERRRLKIINALFVALTRGGGRCSARGARAEELYVSLGELSIHLLSTARRPSNLTDRDASRGTANLMHHLLSPSMPTNRLLV